MRFLLVDRILDLERGKRATGVKNITMSEEFLAYHFPGMPIMPGVLITEALVQLADWVVREESDFTELGLPVSFARLKFRHFVRPGDQLQLEVTVQERAPDRVSFHATAACDGETRATADFTLGIYPLAQYIDSDEARRQYTILTRSRIT